MIAALSPLFIPTVVTATGNGICTQAYNASRPPTAPSTGTPITGLWVYAAIAPGK